ncbi:DUF6456 domain-containing protein [Yoonia sp. BS5-3]|uniref:DUF6456 domain-containing protein n=1 Tax=Yoonia phaeophyticola TaxID=3137369 RepID=A0ABZ2V155_9RHOB
MTARTGSIGSDALPVWVPDAARHYLVHTETGQSIRALARQSDCHPSTVLRQVRRFECRRDDPLIDAALKSLSTRVSKADDDLEREDVMTQTECLQATTGQIVGLTQKQIDQDAKRILRRLCEQGAVLAVAREMETAVVVRDTEHGEQLRTAIVDREIAQAMALKDWITCPNPEGRLARYFITNTGRAALRRLTAEDENRASGFAEKRMDDPGDAGWDIATLDDEPPQSHRYHNTESPLVGLSRRRDRDGELFLKRDLVAVGERLREDFELAQVGMSGVEKWEAFVTGDVVELHPEGPDGAIAARSRVRDALRDLGPGLGDIVLRCCCYLEGLEHTEKSMGWSARSGKIVLRIALQRLKRHYEETQGQFGPMIG